MGNQFITRKDLLDRIGAAFADRDAQYQEKRTRYNKQCKALQEQIKALVNAGRPMACSQQKLAEAIWLVHYTDDWTRAAQQIAETAASLDDPNQSHLPTQDGHGSWGACIHETYRKLEPTVDALQRPGLDPKTIKPLDFMAPYAETSRVIGYLWRLQITDIKPTGINSRDELGAVQTALAQLFFKDELYDLLENNNLGFRFEPDFGTAFSDYLAQTQHPRNGYWGPWYLFDGELVMAHDLSFTFHIVNYRRGDIDRWPLVIDTTLEIKDLLYPYGWRPDANTRFNLHNSYDVAQIFSYGWPHMSRPQKQKVRKEVGDMLAWCLTEAIEAGAFKLNGDDPLETYYFGARFLDTIGFWSRDNLFWYVGDPPRPAGTPSPYELCRTLAVAFAKHDDKSEEAGEVNRILKTAIAQTSAEGELRALS